MYDFDKLRNSKFTDEFVLSLIDRLERTHEFLAKNSWGSSWMRDDYALWLLQGSPEPDGQIGIGDE